MKALRVKNSTAAQRYVWPMALMLSLALSFVACGDDGGGDSEPPGGGGTKNDCFPKMSTDHWRGPGSNPLLFVWASSNFDETEQAQRPRFFANNGTGAVYYFNENGTYSYYSINRGWIDDTGSYKISDIDEESGQGILTFSNVCRTSNAQSERKPLQPNTLVRKFQFVREVEQEGFIYYEPAKPSEYRLPDTLLIIDSILGDGEDLFARQPNP